MPDTTTGTGTAQTRNPDTGRFASVHEAASALESLLTPEGDNQGEEEASGDEQQGAEGEESEELEGSSAEEGDEDEAEGEESEEESDESGSDDDEEGQQQARGRLYTVRVDGKEEKVPESELIAGYSRQQDYTRKTQSLANDRKGFEQEQGSVRQERAEYARLLPELRAALAQGMGQEPNWVQLQADDQKNGTSKFPSEWARWQQNLHRLNTVRAEEQRVTQQQQRDAQAANAARLQQERAALLTALPAWKNPKVAKAASQAIANTMIAAGFAPDDVAIHDHRSLIIADKAAKYDALMAQRPQLRKQMRNAPVVRPGGGAPASQRSGVKAAAQRLNQSGSVRDAANLLEHLI